jgi:hypothetical protein
MADNLITRIKAEEQDEDLQSLMQDCLRDLKRSRSYMGRFYSDWDHALEVYQQQIDEDAKDVRAKKKREPAKQIIPLSYAQVNTFATYLTSLYGQNASLFELEPSGSEDFKLRETSEAILDREVRLNKLYSKIYAFCLDVGRFSIGVFKTSWEYRTIKVKPEGTSANIISFFSPESLADELSVNEVSQEQEIMVCEGTKVYNVSPYNWYPDTRLPLMRWEEGEFVADETVMHVRELARREGVYGIENVERMSTREYEERGETRLEGFDPSKDTDSKGGKNFMVAVTTMQRRLVPKDYGLSESDEEELWVIEIANDKRIVRAEKMEDANMRFTYFAGLLSSDLHARPCDSLSGVIDKLQETITWLMNTRIESVKNNIEKQLVVHPQFIEVEDLQTRSPYIRLKKSAPVIGGVKNFIEQLRTSDPTVTHVQDAQELMRVMQSVSGVSENAMGNFASGRRSATEARNVAAGSGARLKLVGTNIWEMALGPLGRVMLINARQWMSEETFYKVIGEESDETMEAWEEFHKEEWWELVGNEDYFVFDATSQSEKGFVAQSLQELTIALIGNPEMLAATNLDVVKMITRIQELRGVKNLSQFKKDEPIIPTIGGLPGQTEPGGVTQSGPGGGPVPPQPVV